MEKRTRTPAYWLRLIQGAMRPRWKDAPQELREAARELAEELATPTPALARQIELMKALSLAPEEEEDALKGTIYEA